MFLYHTGRGNTPSPNGSYGGDALPQPADENTRTLRKRVQIAYG